jgi:phosphoribosylformylglycinamidine synthase
MVGWLPDATRAGRLGFAREGDTIALAGPFAPALAASELAKLRGEPLPDGLPPIDLAAVRSAHFAIRGAVRVGGLASAHDIAEGGLAVALAECCLAGGLGATIDLAGEDDPWSALFGEAPGGFLISGTHSGVRALGRRTVLHVIGTVGGDSLRIVVKEDVLEASLQEMAAAHRALRDLFP